MAEHQVNKIKSVYKYLFRGFIDIELLDFWDGSNDGQRRRLYVTGEGGVRIDHVLEELVAGKGVIIVGVPPIIKLSGGQERLLDRKIGSS